MPKRIIAIASGGGHWQQLMLMRPAFSHHDVHYLTTLPGLPDEFGITAFSIIPDCNRNSKLEVLRTTAALAKHVWRLRPHIVISTGALPGVLALVLGRLAGARTIWVDSVANAEEMSLSGKLARRYAHLWLTQWEDVAEATGAEFAGRVL
ncbi:UDP-N-acetylglucosamine--LPS N-acetylglucosamine transferase [uncultured Limimaricola sp.]|uniref:UDP-N-acetylglucosamine--LPS N-acetylglucosamine transferase n=1 Tax=uncultured Limimaricola sp. TaxID=2211667 RepID=UPI0030F7BF20